MIRATNLLERLFGEERRRLKVVPHAFGERPVLKGPDLTLKAGTFFDGAGVSGSALYLRSRNVPPVAPK